MRRFVLQMFPWQTAAVAVFSAPPLARAEAGPIRIEGARVWLFAVPEENSDLLTLSAEGREGLLVGRLELNRPEGPVDWKVVLSPEELGGEPIADHWHIRAHQAHWFLVSTRSASHSFLLKLDSDFNRLGLFPLEPGPGVPSNDMFLVEEPGGVAAGPFPDKNLF